MKIAPLYHALKKEDWATPVMVHTGQHYDLNMSDAFFKDLGLPEPEFHLGVGSGSHSEQTGQVMMAYERLLRDQSPDLVVVVGDVNSTMAATLAATKISYGTNSINNGVSRLEWSLSGAIPKHSGSQGFQLSAFSYELGRRPIVAHLEAGLRSFDRTMPEEINRLVTDALADMLWTPSPDADENLLREGIPADKIHRVGNIMIDSLEMLRDSIESQTAYNDLNLNPGRYGVVTLHRPSNVDNPETLSSLCRLLETISRDIPLVFPVHPRTRKNLERFRCASALNNSNGLLLLLEPVNYIRFMNLVLNCRFAITDSGGIQEETTYLGIPCLTLRQHTERPITITEGTNQLCGIEDLQDKVTAILSGPKPASRKIELWDGHTAGRVVEFIRNFRQG
jgi:UDP-N-acetylglucosamine 2-epimerase (non-hydrolysing)